MAVQPQVIHLRTSPHFHRAVSVETIMLNVVYAMLPVCAWSFFQFGISALALILTTTAACALTEHLICVFNGKESTVPNYSSVITGMLLGLTLPPGFPLWMAALGGFVGIVLGKAVFGGIGFNCFNPALVGRAFLQASFTVAITTWTPAGAPGRFTQFIPSTLTFPFTTPPSVNAWVDGLAVDGWSGATPLAAFKFGGETTPLLDAILGTTGGSLGETSSLIILVCGLYLAWKKFLDWRLPASMLGVAFITSGIFWVMDMDKYPSPFLMLFTGGLMLGAWFMASDMVASPVTPLGVWVYGGLMGFLTILIRLKGGLPEGVMYAILLGNAVSPIIDNLTQPRIYGAIKKAKVAK